jgi:3-methylcrotonyl-CoA carboxylase alpha subunit
VDHFLTARTEITPFYDSMLAKLIVHGPTRADALSRALQALDHTLVSGLITNHTYLRQILLSDFFTEGQAFTQTLDQVKFEKPRPVHTGEALDLASLAEFISVPVTGPLADWSNGPAHAYAAAWRNASGKMELRRLRRDKNGNCLILDSPDRRYRDAHLDGTRLTADTGEHVTRAIVHRLSGRSEVLVNGEIHSLAAALAVQPGSRREADPDLVMAPMAGTINSVQALPGAQVQAGDVLAVIEAMKMQLELRAPRAGEIDSVLVQPGAQVRQRQILLRLKPPATEE